jgi:hypothetical protein
MCIFSVMWQAYDYTFLVSGVHESMWCNVDNDHQMLVLNVLLMEYSLMAIQQHVWYDCPISLIDQEGLAEEKDSSKFTCFGVDKVMVF